MKYVRIAMSVIAALAVILGVIWILQGLNILPGSFMTGHMEWTWRGAIMVVVGAGLGWWSRRS
ncbi:MAG: hypothetical protein ACXU8U_12485 [Asticcacaulis sp.]